MLLGMERSKHHYFIKKGEINPQVVKAHKRTINNIGTIVVFARFGLPEHLHRGNGRHFISDKVGPTYSCPVKTNWQTECFVQTFMKATKVELGSMEYLTT